MQTDLFKKAVERKLRFQAMMKLTEDFNTLLNWL